MIGNQQNKGIFPSTIEKLKLLINTRTHPMHFVVVLILYNKDRELPGKAEAAICCHLCLHTVKAGCQL